MVIVKQKNADMSNPTFEFEVFSGKLQTYELIGLIELIACRVQSLNNQENTLTILKPKLVILVLVLVLLG